MKNIAFLIYFSIYIIFMVCWRRPIRTHINVNKNSQQPRTRLFTLRKPIMNNKQSTRHSSKWKHFVWAWCMNIMQCVQPHTNTQMYPIIDSSVENVPFDDWLGKWNHMDMCVTSINLKCWLVKHFFHFKKIKD